LGEIEPFFNSVLTTGEVVNTSIGSTVFVENSGTVTIDEPEEVFLTSFEETLGTGQNITVVLPDTSNSVIGYDESVNEVTSASTNYPVGSHFVLGGILNPNLISEWHDSNSYLGRGAFGQVSKAYYGGTPVAMKTMVNNGTVDLKIAHQKELENIQRLRHPNIVSLITYDETRINWWRRIV